MKLEINLNLSADTCTYIRQEAERRQIPAAMIIKEILAEVIEEYYREPTKAEILEGIREGLQQAIKGEAQPVEQFVL